MTDKKPMALSKDEAFSLLADRLGCSAQSLSFLLGRSIQTESYVSDLMIPNMREAA